MSTPDTMTPLLTTPWIDTNGSPLPVRSLPGLSPKIIQTLRSVYPGIIDSSLQGLLATCSGLADTELGHVDFTGCCFPEEPCGVFQPCITLAIDGSGRRWIAEIGTRALPGPVWCVLPDPQVAVQISDDLPGFIATLRDRAQNGTTLAWLQGVTASAHAVWAHRRALAFRPYSILHPDEEIRGWLAGLPTNAYVYDLRRQSTVRGWPDGVAGPGAQLYRCARLPVFAVAVSPTEGWRVGHPQFPSTHPPVAALYREVATMDIPISRRRRRMKPAAYANVGLRPCA